ncbi:MAG: hypothetical protein RLZZ227_2369 [Pseudomonadota bacterium]|jgi:hypothetical protein
MRGLVRGTGTLLLLLTLAQAGTGMAAPQPAALPQSQVEIPAAAQSATLQVPAGGDLQQALDAARPGDVIELEAGAEYRGTFVLPQKSGAGWIEIRSSAIAEIGDGRVEPAEAHLMPALVATGESVITTAPGAHHFRFTGIEMRPTPGSFIYNLVELGDGEESAEQLPHHFVFDRCYLHGDPVAGTRRGVALNGMHIAVVNSWLADFKEVDADSQALAGWNGPGPFRIENNYVEGAGENLMFGGATPAIANLVPADIEIRGNHFRKDLAWKPDHPTYTGTRWSVKNLLELKNARRVLIEGNVLENNWVAAQNGFAILLTVRNEGGEVPWAAIEDVTFRNNVLTGIAGGFNILAHDDNGKPSSQVSRITIRNNLFENMGGTYGEAALLQVLDGVTDLAVEDNTADNTAAIIVSEGRPHTQVSFSGNAVVANEFGIVGSGTAAGKQTLARYFPDATLADNAFVGGSARDFPMANAFPDSLDEANKAGVDLAQLCAALSAPERDRHCGR